MAAGAFALEVVTPERALLRGGATQVVLRTSEGWMTVLDGHTSLVSDVVPCEVRVTQEDGTIIHIAVHGGFLEVDTSPGAAQGLVEGDGPWSGLSTKVTLLAGVAELSEEIDVGRAQSSQQAAESKEAQERAELRLSVAQGSSS